MAKKTIAASIVSLVYFSSIFLAILEFSVKIPLAHGEFSSEYPTVFVDPQRVVAEVGETFTIQVKVHNLTDNDARRGLLYIPLGNLYSFGLQFSWDPSILEYVNHTLKIPVEEYPDGVLHEPLDEGSTLDIVNEEGVSGAEPGTLYWCEAFSRAPADPFNCQLPYTNATFFNMTFKVKTEGACKLELKKVDLASAGTEHTNPGGRIGWNPQTARYEYLDILSGVFSSSAERDLMVEKASATSPAGEGCNVTIDVTVANNGPFSENFTVSAYYNQSAVVKANFSTTGDWALIDDLYLTELEAGDKYEWSLEWNTTGILGGQNRSRHYIMVNVTKLLEEENIKNNAMLSNVVFITKDKFSDIVVTKLQVKSEYGPPPLIRNETASLDINIWYNGTECTATFNVTVSYEEPNNGIVALKQWTVSLAGGHTWTTMVTWKSQGRLQGEYTFIANASTVEGEVDTDNNKMEQNVSIILPPALQIDVSPCWKKVPPASIGANPEYKVTPDETIKLNASLSYHCTEGAQITEYKWEIRDANLTVVDTKYGEVVDYAFPSGIWVVELTVKDNFELTYNSLRHGTFNYKTRVNVSAEEQPVQELPIILYVGITVIAIIVIAGVAYFLLRRKR